MVARCSDGSHCSVISRNKYTRRVVVSTWRHCATRLCSRVYTKLCTSIAMGLHQCISIHTCVHGCVRVHVHLHMFMYVCMYVCRCLCVFLGGPCPYVIPPSHTFAPCTRSNHEFTHAFLALAREVVQGPCTWGAAEGVELAGMLSLDFEARAALKRWRFLSMALLCSADGCLMSNHERYLKAHRH